MIVSPASLSESSRRAEAAARAKARLGELFDILTRSGFALVVTDPNSADNPIVLVNDAFTRLTGYGEIDAVGRNCRFLQGARTDVVAVGTLKASIEPLENTSIDLLNYRKDGAAFWNRIAITVITQENGAPELMLGALSDVTAEHSRGFLRGSAGAWEWDVQSGRLYGDARFAELYGLDPLEASLGVKTAVFFDQVDPKDRMRVRIAVAGAMNGVQTFSRDYRLLRPDGSVCWVAARGRPHFDDLGRTIRLTGALTDVTGQKRLEEQLRIAQNAGGVGSFEYFCGFGTAAVSDQFCRLLGVNLTDALSVRTINALVEDDSTPIIATWDGMAPGPLPYVEIPIRSGGGRRWLARRGELFSEAAGTRFVGVIYDITAPKAAQARLQRLTETLEEDVKERTRERDMVWTLSRDVFTVTGQDGLLRSVNPAVRQILGYDPAELIGTPLRALAHPDDVEAMINASSLVLSGRPLDDFDCRLRAKDGEYRWLNWSAIGREGEVLGAGRDVTPRKHLEDQLRQSHKMEAVGQLTGGLAHDFNNMLTGVMGSMDIIRRRIAEGRYEDTARFLDAAQASAARAAALTHRLLAFARQQSLDFKAVDVNELVGSMVDLLSRTLGEQVALTVHLQPGLAAAASDPNQLESAVLNLAINARDAMPDGGRLMITTRQTVLPQNKISSLDAGEYVEIEVSDSGTGMPPAVLAKVFDPFFTTKPQGQGTGLGLSMIYGFVRQTGGQVEIDSTPGVGTTIRLQLPKFAGDEALEADPGARKVGEIPLGSGERVLVVEDDPAVLMLVIEVLKDLGYQVTTAPDAKVAIDILNSPALLELLITDVGLPGMSGRQLADAALQLRPDLPVLFMTGYAEKAAVRSEFLEPGMSMITKPFALETLAHEVSKALRR